MDILKKERHVLRGSNEWKYCAGIWYVLSRSWIASRVCFELLFIRLLIDNQMKDFQVEVSLCMLFAHDLMLISLARKQVNHDLDLWRKVFVSNVSKITITKTVYVKFCGSGSRDWKRSVTNRYKVRSNIERGIILGLCRKDMSSTQCLQRHSILLKLHSQKRRLRLQYLS